MKREWKPGDVAMVNNTTKTDDWQIGFCVAVDSPTGGPTWAIGSGRVWSSVTDARPLVVIDPEDREQVERLVSLMTAAEVGDGLSFADAFQAALREFANPKPPKPDEPTGLGAVVADAKGDRWVRGPKGWTNLDATGDCLNWSIFEDIDAVRVLSEGAHS